MTLADYAHLSTALQLIVLVVSAFFIWLQLRKQTALARVANTQALVALSSPFNLQMSQQPKMAEIWRKGSQGEVFENGTEDEQYRSMLKWSLVFYQNVFFQTKSKLLDAEISKAWQQDIEGGVRPKPSAGEILVRPAQKVSSQLRQIYRRVH